jgi:hypothetical protein
MTEGKEVVEDYRAIQLSLAPTRSPSSGRSWSGAASSAAQTSPESRTAAR